MDLDGFRWLLTGAGQQLLADATAGTGDELALGERLRRRASPDRVATALTQADLRRRARAKFGDDADRMYFTPDGLEQATRRGVADHRAARVRAAGLGTVIDLGCGIGGDLVAFARAGLTVAGVDLDPVRVAVAEANLDSLGLGGAVDVADAGHVDHSPFALAFADPSRRGARGRSFRADDWTPPWPFVAGLLTRDSCVKVAPGIPHELVPEDVEAEWVSDRGEVKEAALWSGRLATVRRRATVIGERGLATLTDRDPGTAATTPVGRFLYEPDGAVIRAGLVSAVAAGVEGGLLDPHLAYVGSDAAYRTPFARCFRVLEELPFREKQLRAALRERDVGTLTIMKRGVSVVPDQLRRRLGLRGDRAATIVLTRVGGRGTCLLVEPLGRTAGA
ncbi:MAG: class I SAM-dependent methyltransferase [Marmoricola sp.]